MHSSISIGLGRNPLDPSGPHSNPNYSDFIWCSPSSSSSVGVSDENNYNSHDINYHHSLSRNDIQISPQSHSYYDFLPHHHHHNFHHNLSSTNNSQNSPNGFHSISGHNNSYRSNSSGLAGHYGPPCTLDPIRSEPEECCSGTEYYMPGTRSPGSGYEVWNCHSSSLNNEGTSVGHPSPDDPLLISPNDEEGNGEDGDGIVEMGEDNGSTLVTTRPPRRRNTANKKERRRTMSINNAFADLRDCIPNVPADTKLSKIKTLRLATSYIAYLSDVLSGDDPSRTPAAFTAEISRKMARGDDKRRKELLMAELNNSNHNRHSHGHSTSSSSSTSSLNQDPQHRKTKGRTGWPQHVWALELQQ